MINFHDYIKPFINTKDFEVGFRVGLPIIKHEIGKTPDHKIKDTDYNKVEVNSIKFNSLGSDGINAGVSLRWKRYTDRPGGGVWKTGETNCDGNAFIALSVSGNHEIQASRPILSGVKCTSSGFDLVSVADYMMQGLSFLITGKSFGFISAIMNLASLPINFLNFLSSDTTLTGPIKKDIGDLIPFTREVMELEGNDASIYLDRLVFEPRKGVWFIIKYPELKKQTFIDLYKKYLYLGIADERLSAAMDPSNNAERLVNQAFKDIIGRSPTKSRTDWLMEQLRASGYVEMRQIIARTTDAQACLEKAFHNILGEGSPNHDTRHWLRRLGLKGYAETRQEIAFSRAGQARLERSFLLILGEGSKDHGTRFWLRMLGSIGYKEVHQEIERRLSGQLVCMQAHNGKLWRVKGNGDVIIDGLTTSHGVKFKVVKAPGEAYHIAFCTYNGLFLSTKEGYVTATSSTKDDPQSKFRLLRNGRTFPPSDGYCRVQTWDGRFFRAVNGGGGKLEVSKTYDPLTLFHMLPQPMSVFPSVYMQGHNGKVWNVKANGDVILDGLTTSPGAKFKIIGAPGGKHYHVTFISNNGFVLTMKKGYVTATETTNVDPSSRCRLLLNGGTVKSGVDSNCRVQTWDGRFFRAVNGGGGKIEVSKKFDELTLFHMIPVTRATM